MSLDNKDPELIRWQIQAQWGLSDQFQATGAFLLVLVAAVQILEDDQSRELKTLFLSAVQEAVSELAPELAEGERDRFHMIHTLFLDVVNATWKDSQ